MAVDRLSSSIPPASEGEFLATDALVCDEAYGEELVDARALYELGTELSRLHVGRARAKIDHGRTQREIDHLALGAALADLDPGSSLLLDDPRAHFLNRRTAIDTALTSDDRRIEGLTHQALDIRRRQADRAATAFLASVGYEGDPQDALYSSSSTGALTADQLAVVGTIYVDHGVEDLGWQYFVVASEAAGDAHQSDLLLTAAYRYAPKGSPLLAQDREALTHELSQLGKRVGNSKSGERALYLSARFHALRVSLDPSAFDGDDPLENEILLIDRVMPAHVDRAQTFDDAMTWADVAQEVNDYEIALKSLSSRRDGPEVAERLRTHLRERIEIVAAMGAPFAVTTIANEQGEVAAAFPNPWGTELRERIVGMMASSSVTTRLLAGEAVDAIEVFRDLAAAAPDSPALADYEWQTLQRFPQLADEDHHFLSRLDLSDEDAASNTLDAYWGRQPWWQEWGISLGGGLGTATLVSGLCALGNVPGAAVCGTLGTVGGALGVLGGTAYNRWDDYQNASDVVRQAGQSGFSPIAYDDALKNRGRFGLEFAIAPVAGGPLARLGRRLTGPLMAMMGSEATTAEAAQVGMVAEAVPAAVAMGQVSTPVGVLAGWGGLKNVGATWERFWSHRLVRTATAGAAVADICFIDQNWDVGLKFDGISTPLGFAGTVLYANRYLPRWMGLPGPGMDAVTAVSLGVNVYFQGQAGASWRRIDYDRALKSGYLAALAGNYIMGGVIQGRSFVRRNLFGRRVVSPLFWMADRLTFGVATRSPVRYLFRPTSAYPSLFTNGGSTAHMTFLGSVATAPMAAAGIGAFTYILGKPLGMNPSNAAKQRGLKQFLFYALGGGVVQARLGWYTAAGQAWNRGMGGVIEWMLGREYNPFAGQNLYFADIDDLVKQQADGRPLTPEQRREFVKRVKRGVSEDQPFRSTMFGTPRRVFGNKSVDNLITHAERGSFNYQRAFAQIALGLREDVSSGNMSDRFDWRSVVAINYAARALTSRGQTTNGSGFPVSYAFDHKEVPNYVARLNRGDPALEQILQSGRHTP